MANIMVNGEKLNAFPLKSRMRQDVHSFTPFQHGLEFLIREIRHEKEIKRIQIGKEDLKLPLFAGDMTLYLKVHKNSTKNLLELINMFSKVTGYKMNTQNQ
jgi:hypothetical protein